MTIQKGQQLWKARASHGAKAIFEDPVKLMESCIEYFQWCEDNPLWSEKVGFSQGEACHAEIEHKRAMSIQGLSIFLGVTPRSWYAWRSNRDDLKPVIEWAESIMFEQKLAGAAAGIFNASIIARDLGLADKKITDAVAPKMIIRPPEGPAEPEPPTYTGKNDTD